MIGLALITIVAAFMLHFTKIYVDKIKAEGWNKLTSYTLGVTFAFPFCRGFFMLLVERLAPEIESWRDTLNIVFTVAYFVGYLFFGMGTALGWLFQFITGWLVEEV